MLPLSRDVDEPLSLTLARSTQKGEVASSILLIRDIIDLVMGHLDSCRDWLNAALTCKAFLRSFLEDGLWEPVINGKLRRVRDALGTHATAQVNHRQLILGLVAERERHRVLPRCPPSSNGSGDWMVLTRLGSTATSIAPLNFDEHMMSNADFLYDACSVFGHGAPVCRLDLVDLRLSCELFHVPSRKRVVISESKALDEIWSRAYGIHGVWRGLVIAGEPLLVLHARLNARGSNDCDCAVCTARSYVGPGWMLLSVSFAHISCELRLCSRGPAPLNVLPLSLPCASVPCHLPVTLSPSPPQVSRTTTSPVCSAPTACSTSSMSSPLGWAWITRSFPGRSLWT